MTRDENRGYLLSKQTTADKEILHQKDLTRNETGH
jgi:hypothetical protein